MATVESCTYEEVPYDSHPFHYTHPSTLSTLGTLVGMRPPAVETCRVLELGCADGGNLIPMAYSLPRATVLGIDLSPRQVAIGQKVVDALGIKNLDLRAMSILDFPDDAGTFDYIICHGVYSWVPSVVQDKILEISSKHLAPQGLAYISYNTFPGWHVRRMVREMMCFHVKRFEDRGERVKQAREFLEFLTTNVRLPKGLYAYLLKEEAETLRQQPDYYLLHEHLEDINEPVYFYQFAERAAAQGLQCIGEPKYGDLIGKAPDDVKEVLDRWTTDPVEVEQYLDFIRDRTFRRTVLCHRNVPTSPHLSLDALAGLYVLAHCRPASATPDLWTTRPEDFRTPDGIEVTTDHPLAKLTLVTLAEMFPRSVRFDELWSLVEQKMAAAPTTDDQRVQTDRRTFAQLLLNSYIAGLVEMHTHPAAYAVEASDRPVASAVARLQARHTTRVANLRHYMTDLNDFDLVVLRNLDGTRDRAALVEVLGHAIASGELRRGDDAPQDDRPLQQLLDELLEPSLRRLANQALLVA
ncbi:MAG TPA: class I SAM-dependent methyltransferase [Pirellulales bacterium]|nr:class I SAM-dependent methyltransferase [Pirellulales bacterium]